MSGSLAYSVTAVALPADLVFGSRTGGDVAVR